MDTEIDAVPIPGRRRRAVRAEATPAIPLTDARRVHLHHLQARPALPAGPDGPRGHLALVLPGREDRRHRLERGGQVEPAADHGRPRRRVHGRGTPDAGLHRRLPQPGAAARSRQGRQGQRHGRCARGPRPDRPVQRRDGEVVRARRRLRGHRRGTDRARGPDQRRRRLERRAQRRDRDGGAPLSARRRRRHDALRWREAPRGARPAAAPAPRPPAARRADQPPRRRVGRVARALPGRVRGHGGRRHPRSLLPRQRRQVDPRARPRPRDPVLGQLLELAGAEARPAVEGAEDRRRPTADARPRARVGPDGRQGAPGQGQGPAVGLREAARRGERREGDRARARDRDPARPAARATRSSRRRTCARATATGC